MKIQKHSLIAIFACNFFFAQQNPGFEKSTGLLPDDWNKKNVAQYEVKIDKKEKHSGKNSLQIIGNTSESFQPFSQQVPLDGDGLRKFQLSMYVKSTNTEGNIGLWAQTWDENNQKIGFNNLASNNKTVENNKDWTKYIIEFTVDARAKSVLMGGLLSGKGTVWFDDFELKQIPFSTKEASSEAKKYIDDFTKIIKENSLFSDKLDWDEITSSTARLSMGAETVADTNPALTYIMQTLKAAGDNHSFIESKKAHDSRKLESTKKDEVEAKLLDGNIGYILVPGFNTGNLESGNNFAKKIQDYIQNLDSATDIKGWIVDLRRNTGGNIYPMIAGLSPFLNGDEVLGYFIKNGKKVPWVVKNGKFGKYTTASYQLKNKNPKIAVLIGNRTASAGEATAISLTGKSNVKTIGQPSGGFTTANRSFLLSDGRNLALAVSVEADRTGKEYTGKIQPDILVTPSKDKDADIETAKSWILE